MSDIEAPLVYVMGPSGAGKDSVLRRARTLLGAGPAVLFAHRYITRPADSGGENHVALTRPEFAVRRARGLFAFDWHAHGNDYGIGSEIHAWRRAGFAVVVSGSREHFQHLGPDAPFLRPVVITAPMDMLAARIADRGREDRAAMAERLERGTAFAVDHASLVTIVNDGPLDNAARAFARLIVDLVKPPSSDRRV